MPSRPSRAVVAVVAAAGLLPVACDSGSSSGATTSSTLVVTTTSRPDDGLFRVGLVLPSVGTGAEIGASIEAAVHLAADEINAAGGVDGQRVEILQRDEGDGASSAEVAIQDLLQLGVDAIIGPTSSADVLGTLRRPVTAGVLTCAPTATALALDGFPDSGLLIRTIPSDSLQAAAIATVVEESGNDSAAIVYLDDAYGRPLARAVEAQLRREGATVTTLAGFTTSADSLDEAAATVAAAGPEVVVVLADAANGAQAITSLAEVLDDRVPFVVNDAQRRAAASAQPLPAALLARVTGVAPVAFSGSNSFSTALELEAPDVTGLYAHTGYDCLNLIALGAVASGSVRPATVAAAITAVSSGGTTCTSFSACADGLAAGRNIDYDSPAGVLAIGPSGDPVAAVFEQFAFQDGRDVTVRRFSVGDG
ncbi:MAG: ABC transporter substrate-binding protein [Ilumatobacteraceae bacterium]